ncbi:hypothetical protein DCAR_0102171 [Daucus carota subsp. sativus]|uniref:Tr-type G domain-containing protein n=1 Tax=Daucus carota subsp. sativus TaxID=79200 RepID=A0AAF0W7C4_DAUCS|nr:hypothetical protein DCAR_0102171 [Daucus carota subsp. sativus]
MPRKVKFGVDHDDDDEYDMYDDDYDDCGDDYDYEDDTPRVEEKGVESRTKHVSIDSAIWRCPICTYDNEDNMPCCDICGVFRNPLVKSGSNSNINSGMHLLLHISPFKFDVPSPDDLVSTGMRSSRLGSKVADSKLSTSQVPSRARDSSKNSCEPLVTTKQSGAPSIVSKTNSKRAENDALTSLEGREKKSLSDNLNHMSLNVNSEKLKDVNGERATSQSQYKPEKWMLPNQSEDSLSQLNLAIVGHVDSGKSTLSGRLLHLLGRISQKQMHKYEKDAKNQGKGSFAYAWALDESTEERERGITMTVAVAYFDTKKYHVVLLDSPGHKDFIPNMISGATQADAAVLVIDASPGSFEVGIDSTGGQTREHAQLIRSFGVDQLIVAINKMDGVEYSKDRFNMIKQQLGTFLRSCGFKDSSLYWIPLSAIENQNLVASASDVRLSSWYNGPCLLDTINSIQPPTRDYSKPLRMPICDFIKSQSQGQGSASGKLEAGALRSGSKVLLMPSGDIGVVRSIERDSQPCVVARAGDNVALSLQAIEGSRVKTGDVLCHPDFPVAVAKHLELKVLILDVTTPILAGSQLEFHVHHAKEAARVVKILSLLDSKTGKVTKKAPRCLLSKQSAVVEVVTQETVCVEEFSSSKSLGRVFLRSEGRTVAVGVITRIIE